MENQKSAVVLNCGYLKSYEHDPKFCFIRGLFLLLGKRREAYKHKDTSK